MRRIAIGAACVFLLLGLILIPYAGIEADEVVFAKPCYGLLPPGFSIAAFHRRIPLMVFPYAGSLKTFLLWPVLSVFGPNVWSIRVPVILIGAATIVLFFLLARRMAGSRAAVVGSLLLATDPSFLLTNTYDWGPVALQHLLLVAGCLLMATRRFAFGFFCFGLALWDKAIFVWAIAGLAAGVLAAYLPELRRALGDRRLVIRSALAFIAGALPLIAYNVQAPNATLRANVHPSLDGFSAKVVSLERTLDGSDLFLGVMVAPEWAAGPKAPRSIPGRVAWWIREHIGAWHSDLMLWAVLLALAGAPMWWRSEGRKAALFAVAFCAAAFMAMAAIRYTGGAHHIVLLWPMPHLLVGVAVAAMRPRWLVAAAGTALVAANLVVVNQYIVQFERNGTWGYFTDAIFPLSDVLSDSGRDTIYLLDWGMEDNLNVLHRGRLHFKVAWPLLGASGGGHREEIAAMLADPGGLFLNHVSSEEYFKGTGARLDAFARSEGLARAGVRTIHDSNGRPEFEVYRFAASRGAGRDPVGGP
jgi:Dolichyl-phosphate-mannose-protein mannosyltransferase